MEMNTLQVYHSVTKGCKAPHRAPKGVIVVSKQRRNLNAIS